jgi:hypothetical protein
MHSGAQDIEAKRQPATPTDSTSLDSKSANANRMLILINDGTPSCAITVDTTNIENLRAALKLQELVFRIGGARMQIVDKEYVILGQHWQKIHIRWDHFPMTQPKRPFEISMRESEHTAANPLKEIIIAGSGRDVERAVSAFTESTFGIPLAALEDKAYKWERKKIVAIPGKMKTIYGSYRDR